MNRIFMACALLAVCTLTLVAQEEKPKAETLKFTAKDPGPGDQVVKGMKNNTSMALIMSMGEMGEQEMNQAMTGVEKKTVTILEGSGKKVTKFKVTYSEVKTETRMESAMMPEPMVEDPTAAFELAGNTYVFTIAGEGVKVADEKGQEVAGDKAKFLSDREAPGGKFAAWNPNAAELFSKREITIGETILVPKERAMTLVPNPDLLGKGVSVKIEATLRAKKTVFGVPCGVFDTVTTIEGEPKLPGGGMPGMEATMTSKLTGTLTIGISNMWVYSAKTKGPLNMEASGEIQEGMVMTVKGEGTAATDMQNAYLKVKIPAKK